MLRAPAALYDHNLGWLFGHRMLRLTHTGRGSGRSYRTVLEVFGIDRTKREVFVLVGFGPSSDWYRNIQARPATHNHSVLIVAMRGAYDARAWESFAVAQVGAAAALAGLLVVACSINIARIIEFSGVVSRLAATLTLFAAVLAVGIVLLVPGQDPVALGGEITIVGAVTVALVYRMRGLHGLAHEYRRTATVALALEILAALSMMVAGIAYAVGAAGGLYWLVPGVLLAITVGLLNAWVALIEILR